ncbi:alpha/beta hydrolase family esterase [Tenggerimyces flavus]|uniref:Alpha/beta hydrolase family esterase n=1 Tax=Tenggerimyces flavus TaxID=1708749 RepID=A0ABV7YCB3_9ACTN|nr:prolyl oligopeptidase family serine peptidase [Tenggerimyces flavus]MBM7783382.1 poly(3-hydroxybutyrate) depolymerase [Tenggerimyces flavus]
MPQTTRSVASVVVVLGVLLAALVAAPVANAAGSAGCGKAVTPGTFNRSITVNGVKRTYLIAIPASVKPSTPVPVIMGLHGGSDTAQNANRYMGLTNSYPALYVYPQAPYWPEAGGVGWNVDPAGVDFPYFDALVAELKAKHCVDPARFFAAGKSNGGFMVNSLACYRPGMFRAIAPVAGGGPQTSSCRQGIAAMIVHGSADQVVKIEAGRWSLEYWLHMSEYQGTDPIATKPAPCVRWPGVTRRVYWCQHSGAHIWPTWAGGGIRGFFLTV